MADKELFSGNSGIICAIKKNKHKASSEDYKN